MAETPEEKTAREAAEKAAADKAAAETTVKEKADLVSTVASLVSVIKEQQAAGDARAVERAAVATGLSEDQLQKMITDAQNEGDIGKGLARAVSAIRGESNMATLTAIGMQKVDLLAVHPEYGQAFVKHGPAFRKYLAQSGLNMAGIAAVNPATQKPYSEEIFNYFLTSQTKWYEERASERETKAREDERKKVETEIALRTGKPVAGSLPTGAAPEGGSLRDLVRRTREEAGELTESQLDHARRLGASEEDIKLVVKSRVGRSAAGTPILAIPTSNEGTR